MYPALEPPLLSSKVELSHQTTEAPMQEIALDIRGLGLILYSPPAVAHIAEGADYLGDHFWQPADVAYCSLIRFLVREVVGPNNGS